MLKCCNGRPIIVIFIICVSLSEPLFFPLCLKPHRHRNKHCFLSYKKVEQVTTKTATCTKKPDRNICRYLPTLLSAPATCTQCNAMQSMQSLVVVVVVGPFCVTVQRGAQQMGAVGGMGAVTNHGCGSAAHCYSTQHTHTST